MERDVDAHLALVAHGLLNPMAVVIGVIDTVRVNLGGSYEHDDLLDAARTQAVFVTESLRDMVIGLPPDLIEVLDRMRREGATPAGPEGEPS